MAKVNGYELVCPVCKGNSFEKRSSLLNSRGMTLLGLDWANQGAINYICESCGYIYWFIDDGREYIDEKREEIEKYSEENLTDTNKLVIDYETSKAEEDECPICFTKHDKDQKECTNCGYSFK